MNTNKDRTMDIRCRIPQELIPVILHGLSEGKTISETTRDGLRSLAREKNIKLGKFIEVPF